MRKLLKYISEYKKETISAPLLKLTEALLELFIPVIMARIIDEGIVKYNTHIIVNMGITLFVLAFVCLAVSVSAQYFAAKAAVGFSANLRTALFNHIQKLSYTSLDQTGIASLITKMTSDMEQIQSGVNMALRLLLRSPFVVAGSAIMALFIDVKLASIFLVTILALSVVVFIIMKTSIPLYVKIQGALDNIITSVRDSVMGVRVIRAFNMQEGEKKAFYQKNENLNKLQAVTARLSSLMNPLTQIIVNIGLIALIYFGAIRVNVGSVSQGEVVALINYMTQILVELVKFANLITMVTKSIASGNRVAAIFEIEPEKATSAGDKLGSEGAQAGSTGVKSGSEGAQAGSAAPVSQHGFITMKDVALKYAGASEESLEDINLVVDKGDVIGITGGTGSGKSSLINMIPAFYNNTAGEITIDGKNIEDYKLDELRDKIAFVPQKSVLMSGTIRSNMQMGKKDATDEEMWEALDIAMAKEFVEKRENGLDEIVKEGGTNFSGGQRQRLAIARALVKKPEILILDDSFSALDYATDRQLREKLLAKKKNMTVIIVAQRAISIKDANKILVMDDGRIEAEGTHEYLLANSPLYAEICRS